MGAEQIRQTDHMAAEKAKIESLITEIREQTFRTGYLEGRIEARVSMIGRMRKMGMGWTEIEQITGLGREDYQELHTYWSATVS